MKNIAVCLVLSLALAGTLPGQAAMSPPIIRSTVDQLVFTARFRGFEAGREYRLGVGTTGEKIEGAKIELMRGDNTPVSMELVSFKQGFADNWFDVTQIDVQGFVFSPSQLPAPEEELKLRVTVSRGEADRVERIFVILSRKYGPTRWYIEDGSELNRSNW